jgi:competence protein ComEA
VSLALVLGAGHVAMGQVPAKPKAKAGVKAPLDLNTATAKELADELPGVGEVTAKKIVDGRPYKSIDDLAKAGVPARTIDAIRPLVTVHVAPEPKMRTRVPGKGITKATPTPSAGRPSTTAAPAAKVNLNSASLKELETLPGIGPVLAKGIVDGRPYRAVDELAKVKGLGKTRIAALRDLVVVETPAARPEGRPLTRPALTKAAPAPKAAAATGKLVNINTATKEELDTLPGIGPVKAQAIIEGRPFKSIEDVMKVKGIKQGEFGKIKDRITVE